MKNNSRRYLPTAADLVDRLSILLLKRIFIQEHQAEYDKEIEDVLHDIQLSLDELQNPGPKPPMSAEVIKAMLVNMLCNRYIWENESLARQGRSDQDKLLKLTHSINGIRNTAKNVISQAFGERTDLKVDCFAADLPKEYGNWDLFSKKHNAGEP
jgi:hypothetical protein